MILKLIKTDSDACSCGSKDFKIVCGAKVCLGCFKYFPKELNRDILKERK